MGGWVGGVIWVEVVILASMNTESVDPKVKQARGDKAAVARLEVECPATTFAPDTHFLCFVLCAISELARLHSNHRPCDPVFCSSHDLRPGS